MKKLDSQFQKGKKAEERFIKIARSLDTINPTTLLKVQAKQASVWLDKVGIDVILKLIDGDRVIRVPVQVKRSYYGAEQFRKKYPEYVQVGVLVSVVSDSFTDREIADDLIHKLYEILIFQRTFETFLQKLRKKKRRIIRELVEHPREKRRRNQKNLVVYDE